MKSPYSSSLNESRGIPKGPSLAGCLHVYMLTCLQALGLTPMLARHRGRDSVFHCGGPDGAYADASPQPDGGTLNPAVAGLRCWVAMALAAPVVVRLGRIGPRALWLGLVVCLCGVPLVWGPFWGALCCGALLVLVGGPSAVGLSRSGTPGVGVVAPPVGVCLSCGALPVAGSPIPWSVRLTRWCVLGCVRPGPWCPGCAGVAAWCPYFWGAPHRETTWATPVSAGVGEPEGKARANSACSVGGALAGPLLWWRGASW